MYQILSESPEFYRRFYKKLFFFSGGGNTVQLFVVDSISIV